LDSVLGLKTICSELITPWLRIILDELAVVDHQIKKFVACYGTERFITLFMRAFYWASS
jgi:hypothetical protein